jgi:hypothetical protein
MEKNVLGIITPENYEAYLPKYEPGKSDDDNVEGQ